MLSVIMYNFCAKIVKRKSVIKQHNRTGLNSKKRIAYHEKDNVRFSCASEAHYRAGHKLDRYDVISEVTGRLYG